jgi:hypothetical protein
MTDLVLDLAEKRLALRLFDEAAPRACAALRKRLPLRGEIVHAMWSGPLCLVNGVSLDGAPLENATSLLSLGDVVYHPVHHEIGFAYAATQFREPVGSTYVTMLGRLDGDLAALVEVGSNLQRSGARPVVLATG